MPVTIILDCDPGHDDAIALLLALASPELDLLGVTTTYANQMRRSTTRSRSRPSSVPSSSRCGTGNVESFFDLLVERISRLG